MAKQKFKKLINIFDVVVIVVILLVLGISVYAFKFYKAPTTYTKVQMVVRVPAENVETAASQDKNVYFNGVNRQVHVLSVMKDGQNLLITLSAPGKVDGQIYDFNGQRVLINQKAEIRASYFAQGRIVSISNEN